MGKKSVLTFLHSHHSLAVAKQKPNYVKNWYCSRSPHSLDNCFISPFARIIIMLQNFPIEIQFKFNGIKTKPVRECERAFYGGSFRSSLSAIALFCCDSFFCSVGVFFFGPTHNNGPRQQKHKQTPEDWRWLIYSAEGFCGRQNSLQRATFFCFQRRTRREWIKSGLSWKWQGRLKRLPWCFS